MPEVPETRGQAAALFIAATGPGLFNGLIPARIFEKGNREDIVRMETVAGGVIVGIGVAAAYLTSSSLPLLAALGIVGILVYGHERAMVDRFARRGGHGQKVTGAFDVDDSF